MPEPPESFIGMVLADRYELSSVLGQGQGGIVFKARHRQLDRFVALKLLSPDNMADKTAFMRFEREAHAIGRLNHPNIVTVFDVGRWRNERPFLVMDFIDGCDLQDLIGKEGRLPVPRAFNIGMQVCSALSHAHKRGVIHRDLKPRNIMLIDAEDIMDFVKVVDFGIAKPCDSDQSEALTLDGYVVGTPLYMSPEQCSSQPLDARTDIYAVGTMLFKMLTGSNPITGKNLTEIMSNQINAKPLSFEEACPYIQVAREVQQVIYKTLSKNPSERQSSMGQLRSELEAALELTTAYATKESAVTKDDAPLGVYSNGFTEHSSAKPAENEPRSPSSPQAGFMEQTSTPIASMEPSGFGPMIPNTQAPGSVSGAVSFPAPAPAAAPVSGLTGSFSKPGGNSATDALRDRALTGDAQAQYELVLKLEYGQGCKPNLAEAARWLRQCAQRGHKVAQFRMGDHLLRGEGGFDLSPGEGILWLQKSAEQGYDAAQFSSGWCYQHGLGVQPDLKRAIEYYQLAAKQGNAQAVEQLKQCISTSTQSNGIDSVENEIESDDPETLYVLACKLRDAGMRADDRTKSLALFKKAAMLGHDLAQSDFVEMTLKYSSDKSALMEAMQWVQQASAQSNQRAMLLYAACLRHGIGCANNPQTAMELLNTLATDHKSTLAQAMLGACLLSGDGATRNIPRGIALLKQASDAGDALAHWKLAICSRNGIGTTKDARAVEILFSKSADELFPQGIDDFWKPTSLQFVEAFQIFKSMSSSGNKHAVLWLGICHERGLGTARDLNTALNLFKEAQSKGLAAGQKAIERIKESEKVSL